MKHESGGFVIRDHVGNPLFANTRNLEITSVLIAEAVALRDNLVCARDKGYKKIIEK